MRRKIANTRQVSTREVRFRSVLEKKVAEELINQGISYEYESEKVILMEGFVPKLPFYVDSTEHNEKVRAITYTPDFKISLNGYTVYIEAKGWPNDRYPMKKKLFLRHLQSCSGCIFAEVHSLRGLKNTLIKINKLPKHE